MTPNTFLVVRENVPGYFVMSTRDFYTKYFGMNKTEILQSTHVTIKDVAYRTIHVPLDWIKRKND
tara:strand:+ start:16234 stop:16428 length:195 start_codon:yes stop_codon:yes gene_type:complete